ncbi:MAG: S8/S53 family peptidase [Bacteroidota bacterium]
MNQKYTISFHKITVLILFILFWFPLQGQQIISQCFTMPANITPADYLEGKIIFKMKEETRPYLKAEEITLDEMASIFHRIGALETKKLFPHHQPPAKSFHFSGQPYSDLSRIYSTTITDKETLEEAINSLCMSGLVEYAQPWYIPKTMYTPDDPLMGSQYYLDNIKAYDAWEIEKGDTSIVIAIIDTGIDLLHPDLVNDIAYNYHDSIDGEDSDNDGYVDNFHGWDLGENNNNPQWDVNAHGVHVSGIAAASTNNGTGMAGIGFNSRLLPVKVSDADGRLVRAYEGIIYAADQGAHVINCSWGGTISPGQFGQDIINYAVLNRDAVVIASAGNNDNEVRVFPASYGNAMSVAGTDINDYKWDGSSYGTNIDLAAPGANIFSTWPNGYIASNGTSMAAPIVAGAAALLRSHFPEYNALQIAAQLKVTTDIIDTIPANAAYAELLGTGRLNIYRALTETNHPYLLFSGLEHSTEHYQLYSPGETFELGAEFINLLAPTNSITAILSSQSEYVEILNNQSVLGEVGHMENVNNFEDPFLIRISENIPASHEITFTISFINGGSAFAGRQNFTITFNLDYLDFQANQILTTINSKGNIGFNYPNYNQGVGFLYGSANQNRTLIKCAGFIAGVSTSRVVDNIYGPVEDSFSNAFFSLENARIIEDSELGDIVVKGSFTDSLAENFDIGIKVDYTLYSFSSTPLDKFLILEYDIINISGENQPGFYAGFFADWALQDVRNHRGAFDPDNQLGYAFSAAGGNFTGIQLLSHSNLKHYAFDNQGFGGSMRINNGFTSFQKYTAMKSNRDNSGFFDKDNDISTLLSTGPFNLQPNDTLRVAFALLAGDHLNDLQASAQLALLVFNGEYTSSEEFTGADPFALSVHPNPFTSNLVVAYALPVAEKTEISVYDMSARKIYSHFVNLEETQTQNHTIDTSSWENGAYIIQIRSNHTVQSIKTIKQ